MLNIRLVEICHRMFAPDLVHSIIETSNTHNKITILV